MVTLCIYRSFVLLCSNIMGIAMLEAALLPHRV